MRCALTVLKNIGLTIVGLAFVATAMAVLFTVAVFTMSLLGLNGFPAFGACCLGWLVVGVGTLFGIAECRSWE